MRYLSIILLTLILASQTAEAQKYLTKNGHIRFFSEAPLEDIEANNNQVTSILDIGTGDIVFSLLMKGFHFEKALMEEHFNEKYVHSDKFPKSTFKGNITGGELNELNSGKDIQVQVAGTITIHGISSEITTDAILRMDHEKIIADCTFPITLSDYDISIPGVVRDKIAKTVEVTVSMQYDPYDK